MKNTCQMDVLLLYEVVHDPVMEVMLPINTMRNYALMQVRGTSAQEHV